MESNPCTWLILRYKKDAAGKRWATGTDKIFSSRDGLHWTIEYADNLKTLGQLRGLSVNQYGIAAVGFKGNMIQRIQGEWVNKKIIPNRMRQVVQLEDQAFFAAGDKSAFDQNALVSYNNGLNWNTFPVSADVHRIYESRNHLWLAGKQGLLLKVSKKHLRRKTVKTRHGDG